MWWYNVFKYSRIKWIILLILLILIILYVLPIAVWSHSSRWLEWIETATATEMRRYFHQIERLDKLESVRIKWGRKSAQFCICLSVFEAEPQASTESQPQSLHIVADSKPPQSCRHMYREHECIGEFNYWKHLADYVSYLPNENCPTMHYNYTYWTCYSI